jgi:hypothetical protein
MCSDESIGFHDPASSASSSPKATPAVAFSKTPGVFDTEMRPVTTSR